MGGFNLAPGQDFSSAAAQFAADAVRRKPILGTLLGLGPEEDADQAMPEDMGGVSSMETTPKLRDRIQDDPQSRNNTAQNSAYGEGQSTTGPSGNGHLADLQNQYDQLNQPAAPMTLKQKLLRGFVGAFGSPETNQQLQQREEFEQQQQGSLRNKLLDQIEAERRLQEQEQLSTQRMTLQEKMQAAREQAAQEAQGRLFQQQNQMEDQREAARERAESAQQAASEGRQSAQFAEQEKLADKRLAAQMKLEGMREAQKDKQAGQKLTADEQRRADLANNMNENLDQLEDILNRRPELFGPVGGRLTGLKSSFGTSDPDIAKLNAIKEQMGMAMVGAHAMRNAQHVEAAANAIVNSFHNSTDAIRGAIQGARTSLATFQPQQAAGAQAGPSNLKNKVQNVAPEGTRVQVGNRILVKHNGQWVAAQ